MQTIKRTKLYEAVIQEIQKMIASGQIKPGSKLPPEREMAETLGVSRAALREALTVLEAARVIEIRHGSGAYVLDVNDELLLRPLALVLLTEKGTVIDLLELRKGIEGEAAYLAAERATSEDISILEKILDEIAAGVAKGGLTVHEDFKFHYALAEATGNPAFTKVMNVIADAFHQGLRTSHGMLIQLPGRRETIVKEHRRILECIKKRDAEGARQALREHLERVEKRLEDWASSQ